MEGIYRIMDRIQEIQSKMRDFSGTAQTQPPNSQQSFHDLITDQASGLDGMISEKAEKYGVEQELVRSVIKVESDFNPQAVSPKGAQGLMQLMPGTAREMGVQESFDPEQNVEGGVKFLSQMLSRYGNNRELALAAYNAGPGAVEARGGVPPFGETQDYVNRVLNEYNRLKGNK